VGPADRVALSAKGAPAPRAPLEGAEPRDIKSQLNTDRGAPVAVGAVALGLREALKGEGRSSRELPGQRIEAASRPQRPAIQAASGWALKQNLGAQARGFDRPAAQRAATMPSASAGAEGARLADGLSSPLLAGADRRDLDLVALARPTPGVEGEDAELSEKFATQLAQRVVAQAAAGQLTSRIALNPTQLGPLEVRLELSGDRIAVDFQAHHAMTRELLGDGLGRLKEGLEQAGFEVTRLSAEGRGTSGSGLAGQQGGAFAQGGHADGQASQQGKGQSGTLGAGRSEERSTSSQETAGKGQGSPGNDAGLDITV
jgi:flagellar hook-length control protein FliK